MSAERAVPIRSLRSLTFSVYVPTLLFAVGQGAVLPVIALTALEYDSSIALATAATAVRGIGTMAFDVPAGSLVARFGERRAMAIGTLVLAVALVGCMASPNVYLFLLSVLLMGCGWAVWLLARLTYVAEAIPLQLRGRALSTLGGVNRVGNFIGPFAGAVMIAWIGLDGAYVTHLVLAVLGLVTLWYAIADTGSASDAPRPSHPAVRSVAREHARVLATAGVAVSVIGMLRASRHAVLPLWGAQIGLDAASISLLFGIAAAIDMSLFYPAGAASDRFGRRAIAVPCLTIMAVGFLFVPLTTNFVQLVAVGILIGLGNGIGSGIVMTLGADLSPVGARAPFLGVWRLVSDTGQAGGPLIAAGISSAIGLGAASVAIGGVGILGAALLWATVPETLRESTGESSPSGP